MFESFVLKCLIAAQVLAGTFARTKGESGYQDRMACAAYLTASWLTDPLCKAHQLYRRISVVDILYPEETGLQRAVRKGALFLSSSAHLVLALGTTLPGIEIRLLAGALKGKPFIHFRGQGVEKAFDQKTFSLLSWNLCCVAGGYSITDGGVLPWSFRKDLIIQALREQDADLICLSEIFDIQTALCFIEGLNDLYSHFYFNIGPTAIGLSSGLFVASKASITEAHFLPFPSEALYGRSKLCKKGVFGFDVPVDGTQHARIFSTHFQHSEMADYPEMGELEARQKEMELILRQMAPLDKVCILTGDLNLEEKEFSASSWRESFEKGVILGLGPTWGGDAFCAALVGKVPSNPANLDHTLIKKGMEVSVTTTFIETRFDPSTFKKEALSDHKGLLSIISLQ